MKTGFTEPDLRSIKEAVSEAEQGTAGEIVVFVMTRSSSYEAVLWRGGALALIVAVLCWWFAISFSPLWGATWLTSPPFYSTFFGLAMILGAIVAKSNSMIFRLLAGKSLIQRSTRSRALRAFVEEDVVDTFNRTGILLFLSLFERRIEVVPDKGIGSVVPQEKWDEVVDEMRHHLKAGEPVEALTAGIRVCGSILESVPPIGRAQPNELPDDVRFGES